MIPTRRAWAWFGAISVLAAFGPVAPVLAWLALAGDLAWFVLLVVDGRRAAATPLRLSRRLPERVHQGDRAEVGWVVENRSGRALRLHLRDVLAPQLADRPLACTLEVGPGETRCAAVSLRPRRRGGATLPPFAVRLAGPWGLALATREGGGGERVRVLPATVREGRVGLALRRLIEAGPVPDPGRPGLTGELHALREYLPGDDLRSVDWRATARMGRPIARERTLEQDRHLLLLLDAGRAMGVVEGGASRLDHALAASLALLRVAVAWKDRVTLVLFAREVRRVVRVDRHTRAFAPIFERLHDLQPDGEEPDYEAIAAWTGRRAPRRSLVFLVTSVADLGAAERVLGALAVLARRHEVVLVSLEDPVLRRLAEGRPGTVDEAYLRAAALGVRAANRELARRLRASGAEFLELDADRLTWGMVQRWMALRWAGRA